jgi:PTH1 family peptidyl-tRNA hydrolase
MDSLSASFSCKAIIGLGNPGRSYCFTRHNIGFRVLDALADKYNLVWRSKDSMEVADLSLGQKTVLLVKPQTFMNDSGRVVSFLQRQGIKLDQCTVVHDELELSFGTVANRIGGSARGHNGLRSLIAFGGENFARLRIGIGRPENKEQVAEYVLAPFSEPETTVNQIIERAVDSLEQQCLKIV